MIRIQNPYKVLGVSPKSTISKICKTFHALALANHPDKTGELPLSERKQREEYFKIIRSAFEIMNDHEARQNYDERFAYTEEDDDSNASSGQFRDCPGNSSLDGGPPAGTMSCNPLGCHICKTVYTPNWYHISVPLCNNCTWSVHFRKKTTFTRVTLIIIPTRDDSEPDFMLNVTPRQGPVISYTKMLQKVSCTWALTIDLRADRGAEYDTPDRIWNGWIIQGNMGENFPLQ
ncbi:hypothetical protein B0J11DRAFT_579776 [Dendryphion nanum]|uniref:J domain-containing protein n=1 Tax=Dendryphion nanum TaxID=256645 RepID=A0A9P9DSL5_9PLEO|nr:hypothetical protein B0J11DRAFT_579776 [Dendryphion nanum]